MQSSKSFRQMWGLIGQLQQEQADELVKTALDEASRLPAEYPG